MQTTTCAFSRAIFSRSFTVKTPPLALCSHDHTNTNSLVSQALVGPKQLRASLPVLRDVGGPAADEVLGHLALLRLERQLHGTRMIHPGAPNATPRVELATKRLPVLFCAKLTEESLKVKRPEIFRARGHVVDRPAGRPVTYRRRAADFAHAPLISHKARLETILFRNI